MPISLGLTLGLLLHLQPEAKASPAFSPLRPLNAAELYQKRMRFEDGEPVISVGVAEDRAEIRLSSKTPFRLMFDEAKGSRTLYAPAHTPFVLRPRPKTPGELRYWVLVESFPYSEAREAKQALAAWSKRTPSKLFSVGLVMALGGKLLDTRGFDLGIGRFDSRERAEAMMRQMFHQHGHRTRIFEELSRRPEGQIAIQNLKTGERFLAGASVAINAVKGGQISLDAAHQYWRQLYVALGVTGKLTVVNSIGAEQLLEGLVPAEIFASAPAEALKAQAVAARGELFTKLAHRHFGQPYHLCSEQHCQMYQGSGRERKQTSAAVRATRGQLLLRPSTHPKAPLQLVDSVYSSTCGGFSEANEVVWDNRPSPNLRARLDGDPNDLFLAPFAKGLSESNIRRWLESVPPTYESRSSFVKMDRFRWRQSFKGGALAAKLAPLGIGRLKKLKILGRGPGGRVTGLRLIGETGQRDVLRELPVRRLFDLYSGMFVVDAKTDAAGWITELQFVGGGWGHGVGMCQVGAIGRAEAGQDYRQILDHYYSGAKVVRIY